MSDCCPGSKTMDFSDDEQTEDETGARQSQLKQWPIQLHLVSPQAPYFQEKRHFTCCRLRAFYFGRFPQRPSER